MRSRAYTPGVRSRSTGIGGRTIRSLGVAIILWGGILLSAPVLANATTINFDELHLGGSNPPTQHVSNDYASLGVLFSYISPAGTRGPMTIVADPFYGNGASSPHNAAAFGFNGGVAVATFVDPLSGADSVTDFFGASVGDRSREADPITVQAYDIHGRLIGSTSFTSQPTNTLGLHDFGIVSLQLAGIHELRFIDASPSGADFDNLTFQTKPVHGAPVPEPATMGFSVLGLAAALRRRRSAASE